ncbi:glycoside hydrolase family 79 protein [Desarmillaria tabescens]|uniref:Glycoside hydrolase family 79 protein n=1 Tax=Armillaria tabescens TaxID=1929756 RepID=A0AA39KHI0_ARMTA|nr:glycoside hydrolase family 79 protein [Desarmillaria tabescens]KAK0458968.1 glycoside hydrolase family 79 protein [Desarmillaria tabescens]
MQPLPLLLAFSACVLAENLSNIRLSGPPTLPPDASKYLNPALASFSIETAFWTSYVGNVSNPNSLTRNLLENLKSRTGVPAEIRIGGITADSTYYNSTLDMALFNFITDEYDLCGTLHNTTVGPEFWKTTDLLPEGTKIVFNLDLEDLDFEGALDMATAAVENMKAGQLIGMEIGNEPDHYLGFTPRSYTNIWMPWTKNISDALNISTPFFQIAATAEDPLWPYGTAAANAQLDCVSALAVGANNDSTVKTCSEHTYQYSVCDPVRLRQATLVNLVNHTRLAQYLDLWQPRIKSVREQLGSDSFVIGEYNSVSCSGRDGVSNTFGQALWLLDTTLYAASINVSRLFMHQGGPLALQSSTQLNHGGLSLYDMWYPIENLNGPVKVFPSYSAYLFIAEAIGTSQSLRIGNIYPGRQANGSSITAAMGDASQGQLVAYGFWDDSSLGYPVKLALLNLQSYNETEEGTRPSTMFDISKYLSEGKGSVTVRRLQAPGADVKEGNVTTWAGQTYANGVAEGELIEEKIDGEVIVVAASEAVLVSL